MDHGNGDGTPTAGALALVLLAAALSHHTQVAADVQTVRYSSQPAASSHSAGATAPPSDLACLDEPGTFQLSACSFCYRLVFSTSAELTSRLPSPSGSGIISLPDVNNKTAWERTCRATTGDPIKCDQWQACCRKANECCQRRSNDVSAALIGGAGRCARVWDGYVCWPATDPGEQAWQSCPDHVTGFNSSVLVGRLCRRDGTWQRAGDGTSWTEYGTCKATTAEQQSQSAPEGSHVGTTSPEDADSGSDDALASEKLKRSTASVSGRPPDAAPQCRYWDGYIDRKSYELITCGHCYKYLFPEDTELVPYGAYLVSVNGTVLPHGAFVRPDVSNRTATQLICRTLGSRASCGQWRQCCEAARRCCDRQLDDASTAAIGGDRSAWCPSTWDGYACWDWTRAGVSEVIVCPAYVPHAVPSGHAVKTCTENGTWYRSNSDKEWTNYTACVEFGEFKVNIYIKIACSAISLLVLVPSIAIFLSYRSLRTQHRVRLHINLFASFVLYALINILWESLVVYEMMSKDSAVSRMDANTPGCQLLYVMTRYARSANFIWMFCEAFYLHRLIVKAFQPPSRLTLFYVFGWGFPWLPIGVYSILRLFMKNESCWVQHIGPYEWIIYIPNLVALLANLVFLIDILRILLTQLQSHPNEPSNYRRALKATFVLVPLFGLQLFVIIYRPPLSSRAGIVYENIAAFVVNSQGFFVALIFCLINGEVLTNLRRTCMRLGCYKPDGLSRNGNYTMTTQATDAYPRESPSSSFRTADAGAAKRKDYIALKPISNNNGSLG